MTGITDEMVNAGWGASSSDQVTKDEVRQGEPVAWTRLMDLAEEAYQDVGADIQEGRDPASCEVPEWARLVVQINAPAHPAPAEPSAEAGLKVDEIMEQAQVFASAWSLVGGPFDSGDCLDHATDEKARLREMVREALTGPQSTPLRWPHDDMGTPTPPADDDTGDGTPFHVV